MAFAGSTVADVWGDLKEYYSKREVINNLILKNRPLWAMLTKNPDFSGKLFPSPIIIGGSAGGGANFATAQTNQSPSVIREFQIPAIEQYQLATLTNKARMASRNDAGAFMSAMKIEIDSALRTISNQYAQMIYRNGTGVIGAIGAGGFTATGLFTLADPSDSVNFTINMVLQPVSTGNVQRTPGYIVAMDPSLGTITVALTQGGVPNSIAGWVATDQLVQQSNYNSVITGLAGWLPQGDSRPRANGTQAQNMLFGVDRSVNAQALAGTYYDGTSENIEEAIIDGLSEVFKFSGNPDYVFVNPVSFRALQKTMQSRHEYVDVETEAGVSFSALKFMSDAGPIGVISDPYCIPKTAFALQMDTFSIPSYGECPAVLLYEDGIPAFRVSNADALEVRIAGYANVACTAPGWSGVFKLPV